MFFDALEIMKVTMNPEEIDSYVFMVGNRKSVSKLGKELTDLVSNLALIYVTHYCL